MGYDCTLHLVDEKAIRDVFVPKLLGRISGETPFDRVMKKDAARLWKTGRKALADGDADTICQLAVMFSSCSLPHHFERGFALSLWPDREEYAATIPSKLAANPEELFAELVRLHPRLKRRFPDSFTGNYSTGVFIPSAKVPAALAWIEKRLASIPKGPRRDFRGLLGVMRTAAERKLAYWEATDLAIPATGEVPGDPALMTASFLGNEPAKASAKAEIIKLSGARVILTGWSPDRLVFADPKPWVTVVVDLSTWPPKVWKRPEWTWAAAASRDGRWVHFSETTKNGPAWDFAPRIVVDPSKPGKLLRVKTGGARPTFADGGFVGGDVVGFPQDSLFQEHPVPFVETRGELVPARGFPDNGYRVKGFVALGDGSDIVIWGDDGYERRGATFERTWKLSIEDSYEDWSCVPAGRDGFFYLSDRRLFEVHRGSKPVAHLKKVTNAMFLGPGPRGSVLITEGDNKDGDEAKLYFPATGKVVHLEPELFDDKEYEFVWWSAGGRRFVAHDWGRLVAIPEDAVLGGSR